MTDLIVFSVGDNKYAMNIENVQRIIQSEALTNIPNAHKFIDGMMSYEEKVIKVLNFRNVINMPSYDVELEKLFSKLMNAHELWIEELRRAVEDGVSFTKTTDPHICELGQWLDVFNSYDDEVSAVLKDLMEHHKLLHTSGEEALALYKQDPEAAKKLVSTEIYDTYNHTMGDLKLFVGNLCLVANSLQKLIIYDNNGALFAIKVDTIEDIAHIQESEFKNTTNENEENEFLELEGVLDMDGVLINVIKTVNLPK